VDSNDASAERKEGEREREGPHGKGMSVRGEEFK